MRFLIVSCCIISDITWNCLSLLSIISLDPHGFIAFGSLKLSPQFLIAMSYTYMVPLLYLSGGHLHSPRQSGCKAPPFPASTAHAFTKHFMCVGKDPRAKHKVFHYPFPQPCRLIVMPCLSPADSSPSIL